MATTLYQKLLVLREHMKLLSNYDRGFVRRMLDGLDGLGSPPNHIVSEYLSDKQIEYINKLYTGVCSG